MRLIFAALLFALTIFNTIELSSQSDKVPPNQEIPSINKEFPARRINNRLYRTRIPGIITFSDSSSNSRESEEISSIRQTRSRSPSPPRRIIFHRVDSASSTNDRQNQERLIIHKSPAREHVPGSPVCSTTSTGSNEPDLDEDSRSSGKHIRFRVHWKWKGVGIEGTECNLYYPSTISAKRIEGPRISVITSNTPNNIIPVAEKQVF